MPELTVEKKREYVEAAWDYEFLVLKNGGSFRPWHGWIGVVNQPGNWSHWFTTEALAIHDAYLFTLERQEEIRQLEREIDRAESTLWSESDWCMYLEWQEDEDHIHHMVRQQCMDARILASLQRELEQL